MIKFIFSSFILALTVCNAQAQSKQKLENSNVKEQLNSRYEKLLDYPVDSVGFPRNMSVKTGLIKKVPSKDWTSGFFVGNLWQIYQLTGDVRYKERAAIWNAFMETDLFKRS